MLLQQKFYLFPLEKGSVACYGACYVDQAGLKLMICLCILSEGFQIMCHCIWPILSLAVFVSPSKTGSYYMSLTGMELAISRPWWTQNLIRDPISSASYLECWD